MKFVRLFSYIFLIYFSLNTSLAFSAQAEDISVKLTPENPKPFSDVTISLESLNVNIDNANIEWKSNGKTVLSGQGKKTYVFKTGGSNTNTNFEVSILPENSSISIKKTINIAPSDIDILWEAVDSYTPPFYKGKALPTKQSKIKVTAFPNTSGLSQINQKNLTYTWKNDFNTIKNSSGLGKNTYTFLNSEIKNVEKIGLDIINQSGSYKSSGNLNINIVSPEVIFYKKSPLEGILYQKSIENNDFIEEDEVTIVVEPFFISSIENRNTFKYEWEINNTRIDTPTNPFELTVRPSSRGGYATINFMIENINKLFQKVEKSIKIEL